ncbi:MAG: hypothetical protein KDD73_02835 [Anaerolineales bacterium]|nr:hypothetical protein [Anaerolineales bacterium]MCB9127107.1 hypothetical protein [Ardenticatenales bacterium]
MTLKKTIVLLFGMLLMTGCGMAAHTTEPVVEAVNDSQIVRTLGYVESDTNKNGPRYDVGLALPDEWVGRVETRETPNVLYFDYRMEGGETAQLFAIEALSERQWAQQSGSSQTAHDELLHNRETVFVYNVAADPYFAGLARDDYDALVAQLPSVVQSLTVSPAAAP